MTRPHSHVIIRQAPDGSYSLLNGIGATTPCDDPVEVIARLVLLYGLTDEEFLDARLRASQLAEASRREVAPC